MPGKLGRVKKPPVLDTRVVDGDTGEVLLEIEAITACFPKKYHPGNHSSVLQNASTLLARDKSLNCTDHRILRWIEGRLQYPNKSEKRYDTWLYISQKDLALELEMNPASVSRSLKKLVGKDILTRLGDGRMSEYYTASAGIYWRGHHKDWCERQSETVPFRLIDGGKKESQEQAS